MPNYFSNITARSIEGLLIVSVFMLLQCLGSCNAVFEKDISEDTLSLIIPVNNDTSATNNVHFKWEKLKGAAFYHLQIVKPSFASIDYFVLDSNINALEYYYVLTPGAYQFKIRAENSAYQTAWVGPYNLVIDSISDLTNQVVPLIAPADLVYSNASVFTFSWQSVFSAETYEFQLRSGADFASSGTTLHSTNGIYGTSYSTPAGLFATEGAYSWGVKAVNQTSASGFSDRTLYIDLTAPNSPLSVSPSHGASFADTVVLKWSNGTDPGSIHAPVSSIVQIGSDTLFGSVLANYTVTTDSLQHVFTSAGTFWWRVYNVDAAGNISTNYSAHRKIVIP